MPSSTAATALRARRIYCNQLQFNPLYYAPGPTVANVPRASSATALPGYVTGATAFQLGNVANVVGENGAAYNGGFFDERGVDFSLSYVTLLPGGSTLSIRSLTTWTGEQVVQDSPGGVTYNILNATGGGGLFLPNYQPAARWRGNVYVTWNVANFSLTPNVSWVGQGTISNSDLSCSCGGLLQYVDAVQLAGERLLRATPATRRPPRRPLRGSGTVCCRGGLSEPCAVVLPVRTERLLHAGQDPGHQGTAAVGTGQQRAQQGAPVRRATTPGASAAFYDQLGQAYRVGFRMTF